MRTLGGRISGAVKRIQAKRGKLGSLSTGRSAAATGPGREGPYLSSHPNLQ